MQKYQLPENKVQSYDKVADNRCKVNTTKDNRRRLWSVQQVAKQSENAVHNTQSNLMLYLPCLPSLHHLTRSVKSNISIIINAHPITNVVCWQTRLQLPLQLQKLTCLLHSHTTLQCYKKCTKIHTTLQWDITLKDLNHFHILQSRGLQTLSQVGQAANKFYAHGQDYTRRIQKSRLEDGELAVLHHINR